MQIILISDRLAKTRSVTLSSRHLVGTAIAALIAILCATVGLYWLTLRYAADARIPALQQLVISANDAEAERAGEVFAQPREARAKTDASQRERIVEKTPRDEQRAHEELQRRRDDGSGRCEEFDD